MRLSRSIASVVAPSQNARYDGCFVHVPRRTALQRRMSRNNSSMSSRKLIDELPAAIGSGIWVPLTLGMTWQDRISVSADVLVGKPVITGTRIAVEIVLDLLAAGQV